MRSTFFTIKSVLGFWSRSVSVLFVQGKQFAFLFLNLNF